MSAAAIVLLLLAAVLHAAWNLVIKRAQDGEGSLWWALLLGGLLLTPSLASAWPLPVEALAIALAASVFQTFYLLALGAAYRVGDFSLVYPVARGSAPLLIALWAVLLLGERPSPGGLAGIGLVVVGLVAAGAPGRSTPAQAHERPLRALGLALATGACISGSSTLYKLGVSHVPAPTFVCVYHLGTALLVAPYLVRKRGEALLLPWRRERGQTLLLALMVSGGSVLVVTAMAIERASYVGAMRELSVVLGALAGWLILGEPLGLRRTLAAGVIFAGLALIAVLG